MIRSTHEKRRALPSRIIMPATTQVGCPAAQSPYDNSSESVFFCKFVQYIHTITLSASLTNLQAELLKKGVIYGPRCIVCTIRAKVSCVHTYKKGGKRKVEKRQRKRLLERGGGQRVGMEEGKTPKDMIAAHKNIYGKQLSYIINNLRGSKAYVLKSSNELYDS